MLLEGQLKNKKIMIENYKTSLQLIVFAIVLGIMKDILFGFHIFPKSTGEFAFIGVILFIDFLALRLILK